MAENLAPPRQFNTGAADQYTEWKTWIDAFDIYAMALELEKKSNDVQLATMLHCLGPSVYGWRNGAKFMNLNNDSTLRISIHIVE